MTTTGVHIPLFGLIALAIYAIGCVWLLIEFITAPIIEDDDTLYLTTDDLADSDERIVSFFRAQQASHPWEKGVGGKGCQGGGAERALFSHDGAGCSR